VVFNPPGKSYKIVGSWFEWRLTVWEVLPGDNDSVSELLECMRMTVRVVPLGDVCSVGVSSGATRLAARVPRQAIWKRQRLAPREQR